MLTVDLPKEVEARLDRLSSETGRSMADHVLEAILEYLDDLEDLHLAEQRLRDLRAGRRGATP